MDIAKEIVVRVHAIMLPSSDFSVTHCNIRELGWHSGHLMDCQVTARGSNHSWNSEKKKPSSTSFARDSKWGCLL